jgi:hypothetical protein
MAHTTPIGPLADTTMRSIPLAPRTCDGRGTAEVKTNDVTGRVKEGEAGFVIEFGRPSVGARFRDIQEMTKALAALVNCIALLLITWAASLVAAAQYPAEPGLRARPDSNRRD